MAGSHGTVQYTSGCVFVLAMYLVHLLDKMQIGRSPSLAPASNIPVPAAALHARLASSPHLPDTPSYALLANLPFPMHSPILSTLGDAPVVARLLA